MLSFRNRACKKTLPSTTGLQFWLRKKVIVRSSPENSPISARAPTDFNSRSRRKSRARPWSRARPRCRSRCRLGSRITATKFIPRLTARWNGRRGDSLTRWEITAALPPYICAPCNLSAIVFGEADPPTAYIWSARRGETILLKTRNSRVASRVPGYFF